MEEQDELCSEQKQLLLKEYELCQDAAYKLEATIWQTSAVIGVGSIGSLVLLIRAQPPWLVAGAVGVLVNVAACIWWHMARRWWSIQHVKFLRMRHIEESIGLYQTRYLRYLDERVDKKTEDAKASLVEMCVPNGAIWRESVVQDLEHLRETHQIKGVQDFLKWFPLWNAVAWGIYVIYLLLEPFLPPWIEANQHLLGAVPCVLHP